MTVREKSQTGHVLVTNKNTVQSFNSYSANSSILKTGQFLNLFHSPNGQLLLSSASISNTT